MTTQPTPQRLNIDLIASQLTEAKQAFLGEIHHFDSLDSTNNWLMKNGQCGDVCLSEQQTSGKGRRGNQWVSPDQANIYFSFCWCFEEIEQHGSLLGLITALAVADALSDIGLSKHGIKWPNDIFWDNRKLGGILLELQHQPAQALTQNSPPSPHRLIAGIGLNICLSKEDSNNQKIDRPWVSLQDAMPITAEIREHLIARLIDRLSQAYTGFKQFDFAQFEKAWAKHDTLLGKQISFQQEKTTIFGTVTGLDQSGRIGILHETGETAYYSSGDICLLHTNETTDNGKL